MRNELYHHGIKGQKWGIRRYQNADGTLTEAGKIRYRTDSNRVGGQNKTQSRRDFLDAIDKASSEEKP